MDLYLGTVTEIIDDKKFVIKFTIPGMIENAKAFPVDTFDEPNEGDPLLLYGIETIFGYSYLYKKLRLADHTRMKLLDSIIDIFDDHIEITSKDTTIMVNGDGTCTIKPKESLTIETKEVSLKNESTTLESSSSFEIKSPTITVDGANVTITGGVLTVNGSVAPTGSGPFCGITVCPFAGVPHVGPKVTGT